MAFGVGQVQQVKILSPQEHLANALELRAAQLQIDQQESETAAKLKADAAKAKRQAWLQTAAKTYTHDDGSPDFDGMERAAMQEDPEMGMQFADWNGKRRNQAAQNRKLEVENEAADYEEDLYKLQRMIDPAGFAIWGPRLKDDALKQAIGTEFGPDTPQRIQQLIEAGMSQKDWLSHQKALAGKYGKDPEQAFLDDIRVSRNDDDVANAFEALKAYAGRDVVSRYRQMFAGPWSEDMQQRAAERSMTANEVADNATALANSQRATQNAAPNVGSFEDYVTRTYGANPTPAQVLAARKAYGQADDRPPVINITNAPLPASVPPQAQSVVARIITGIPGTQVGTIKNEVGRLAASGDEEALKSYLRYAATRTVGEGRREVMRGRIETLTALQDAESVLKQVPTGLLTGTWEDVMRRLGKTSDPRLVDLGTRMGAILSNYMRSISGAAVSDNEAARLKPLIPDYRKELPVNLGNIRGMTEAIKSFDRGFYQNTFGENYDWVMGTGGGGGGRAGGGGGGQADPMGIR